MLKTTLAALLLSTIACAAWAEETIYVDPRATISPESFTDISVRLADDARNGCWTNLGEVKTYAEDKLALKGFTVVPHDDDRPRNPDQAVFNVHVLSGRAGNNGCFGVITVDLMSMMIWNDFVSFNGPIGVETNNIFAQAENANILTLETVERFVKIWPQGVNSLGDE